MRVLKFQGTAAGSPLEEKSILLPMLDDITKDPLSTGHPPPTPPQAKPATGQGGGGGGGGDTALVLQQMFLFSPLKQLHTPGGIIFKRRAS